jgi:hypothetical protein
MQSDQVFYRGQPVALVVAQTLETAVAAASPSGSNTPKNRSALRSTARTSKRSNGPAAAIRGQSYKRIKPHLFPVR